MELHFFQWDLRNARQPPSSSTTLILFLHGLGGTGQIWRPIAASLEDEFCCIAPDQRGHGLSRPVPMKEVESFHSTDYAQDLVQLLNETALAPAIEKILIVGHSMGVRSGLATLIQLIQEKSPLVSKIRGFISVDIGLQNQWGGGIGKPLAEFIQQLPASFTDRNQMREYLFQHCPDPSIAQYLSAVSKKVPLDEGEGWVFPFDHEALVKTIEQADPTPIEDWIQEIVHSEIPILALRGEKSKVWLKKDFENSKKKMNHPKLHFEEWPECGHGLPFEKREKFVKRIRDFIENPNK